MLGNNRNCNCSNTNQTDSVADMFENCSEREKLQSSMLMEIKSLNFAVVELALYLDTHPDDQKALCLHNKYSNQLKELKDKYQKIFGPLDFYFPCNKWRWLEEPWPWERRINNVDL